MQCFRELTKYTFNYSLNLFTETPKHNILEYL
jgi:hypothetical protein